MGPIIFSPEDSHTEGWLFLLHLGLHGVTKVESDPKGRFASFKVIPFNDRVLCVCAPWGHRTRLAKGRFFEGLQNDMENKNEINEDK